MEECMSKSARVEENVEVEVSHENVRSRDIEVPSKRLKVELEQGCGTSPEASVSPAVSKSSEQVALSTGVSNNNEANDGADMKVDLSESEISVCSNGRLRNVDNEERTTTLLSPSEICAHSEDTESSSMSQKTLPAPAISNCTTLTIPNMPSAEEIEEFFSAAEKYEQKRFADKYNFDIVNDIPLEGGRYKWFKLVGEDPIAKK